MISATKTNGKQTRAKQRGFTLVEVMVALAIVAIALPALMSQLVQFMDGSEYIRDKTYATWIAQNQLELQKVDYALHGNLLKGSASGETDMMGRTWYWTVESELQPSEAVPGIWKQTVTVGTEPEDVMALVTGYLRESLEQQAPGSGP